MTKNHPKNNFKSIMINIIEEVKDAGSIGISGHVRPDGDCVGSCLGLYLYLKKVYPKKEIDIYLEHPGHCFAGIPAIDDVKTTAPVGKVYDIFILLDTVPNRLGDFEKLFNSAKKTINIDHHVSNKDGSGDVNYIVPGASSTGELIYNLTEKQFMDRDIATLLYMAVAHDTGVFRFSNTTADTMRCAADLIGYGFDFSDLLDKTFFEKTYLQNKVQGHVVIDSKLYFDGKLIVGVATGEFMNKYGATTDDFDGVVNQLLLTQGVLSAVFIYEKKPGVLKFSMRSKTDDVNVSSVSVSMGGGGHVRAAGFDYNGDLTEGMNKVIELIGKQINV